MSDSSELPGRDIKGERLPAPVGRQFASYPGESAFVSGTGIRDILLAIRRHAWVVLLVTVLTASPVFYLVRTEQPQYRAEALIRLVDGRGAMTGSAEAPPALPGSKADAILSQLEVLRGRNVLGQVVDREGLRMQTITTGLPAGFLSDVSVSPTAPSGQLRLEFGSGRIDIISTGGRTSFPPGGVIETGGVRFRIAAAPPVPAVDLDIIPRDVAIDILAVSVNAYSRQNTDAVVVEYAHHDPAVAQRVVNAVVLAFQQTNAESAQQQSRRRRVFLEQQLQATDSMMADVQYALAAFRTRTQVFGSRERQVAQQQGLMDLELRSQELAAERRTFQQLLSQLDRQNDSDRKNTLRTLIAFPGMAGNAVVLQLYSQLSEYERDRDAMTAGRQGSTTANPDVLRLNGLIAGTQNSLVEAARSHLFLLDARIEALGDLSQRNRLELGSLPQAEAEELRLVQNLESVSRMADHLRQEVQKARMAEAVEAGQVEIIFAAPLPTSSVPTRKSLKLATGILLGLILGGAGAFALEAANTSLRRKEDLESALQVRSLAIIPRLVPQKGRTSRLLPGRRNAEPADVITRLETQGVFLHHTPGATSYRMLHNSLAFSRPGRDIKILAVTSTAPGEGKTTTCANLAVAYAQEGHRVLILDCDIIRARVHTIFGLEREPGVSDLLEGTTTFWKSVQATPVEGVHVIPAGSPNTTRSGFLNAKGMKELLEMSRCEFDILIVDTPPLLASPDATALCSMADGVLMVVRAGQTDRAAASYAVQQLELTGANVLGAVLNDSESVSKKYGDYYAYYGDR
jgi:polysaccharide biosynthesis transport protein